MHRSLRLAALALVALTAQPALAHHSTSAIFENDKTITVTGTLTKVDWINPHIAIYLEVGGGAAVETWKIQGNPPAWWRTVGVGRADFARGLAQKVVIDALPAQDGSKYGYLRRIRFANGETLESLNSL
ncbi:MAG: hypothetical protein HY824_06455 [Acidobacteria bacterium]|nr:hypothetical protein [Acidobacteriota bacterium]